ncbi:MAG: hypothetical protein AB1422_10565, partial [bacterium]
FLLVSIFVTIHHEGYGEHEVKFDELSNRVIGCAIAVHRTLGPSLLDTVKSDNSQFTIHHSPLLRKFREEIVNCEW